MSEIHVKVHAEADGFWAEVEELPGCFASGRSLAELERALNEAIDLYLADEPGSAPELRPGVLGTELTEVVKIPVAG